MIYYDVTKMGAARHKSGLMRVSAQLLGALGRVAHRVSWKGGRFVDTERGTPVAFRADDWLVTVELFSTAERPGFREFIAARPCRLGAVFADAIPLKFPHITWPQSVQRHPDYMKLLAGFDVVWAISDFVGAELTGFWRWQGVTPRAVVRRVELGADFDGSPRAIRRWRGCMLRRGRWFSPPSPRGTACPSWRRCGAACRACAATCRCCMRTRRPEAALWPP